jgi:hypothetical protein
MGKSKDLATRVGIDDNADATAITITSQENVGIGTASPSNYGAAYTSLGVSGSSASAIEGFVGSNLVGYLQAYNTAVLVGSKTNVPLKLVTNDTIQMTIDGSGRVTKPNQPAFEAYVATGSSAVLPTGIHKFSSSSAFNSHVFTNINFNIGSHYNSSNSRFTAPAAGRYLIYGGVATSSASSSAYMSYEFYISGTRKADGWNAKPGGYHKESSWRIFNLAANDYVEPGYENGSAMQVLSQGSTNNNYIYFGGYFLG